MADKPKFTLSTDHTVYRPVNICLITAHIHKLHGSWTTAVRKCLSLFSSAHGDRSLVMKRGQDAALNSSVKIPSARWHTTTGWAVKLWVRERPCSMHLFLDKRLQLQPWQGVPLPQEEGLSTTGENRCKAPAAAFTTTAICPLPTPWLLQLSPATITPVTNIQQPEEALRKGQGRSWL